MRSIISFLEEVIRMLGGLFGGQDAAIEHLRQLIEGDAPTVTVTGIEIQQA